MFQPCNKFEALNIPIGIDPFSPFNPFHGIEEADLLIIADGPGAHVY
jgi:hypothetical protein